MGKFGWFLAVVGIAAVLAVAAFAMFVRNDMTSGATAPIVKGEEEVNVTVTSTKGQGYDGGCMLAVPNHELYAYTSADGVTFTKGAHLASRTSVPNLFYDDRDGTVIVTFQSFSQVGGLCDRMAYVRMTTDGTLLGDLAPIALESASYMNGFDPTLMSVEDAPVLVYTVRPQGRKFPCISVATASSDDIADGFVDAENILWCSDDDTENFMDASALVSPDGQSMYLYVPSDKAMGSATPVSYYAKVDISSDDARAWEIVETGSVTDAGLFLLGEMVAQPEDASCPYLFFGTRNGELFRACSNDGLAFTGAQRIMSGADPGAIRLPDGSYLLVVTE